MLGVSFSKHDKVSNICVIMSFKSASYDMSVRQLYDCSLLLFERSGGYNFAVDDWSDRVPRYPPHMSISITADTQTDDVNVWGTTYIYIATIYAYDVRRVVRNDLPVCNVVDGVYLRCIPLRQYTPTLCLLEYITSNIGAIVEYMRVADSNLSEYLPRLATLAGYVTCAHIVDNTI